MQVLKEMSGNEENRFECLNGEKKNQKNDDDIGNDYENDYGYYET